MTSMFSNLSKLLDQLAVDYLATQPHACLPEFGTQLQKQGQPHAKQQPINRNPHDQVVERNVSKSSSVTCPKPKTLDHVEYHHKFKEEWWELPATSTISPGTSSVAGVMESIPEQHRMYQIINTYMTSSDVYKRRDMTIIDSRISTTPQYHKNLTHHSVELLPPLLDKL